MPRLSFGISGSYSARRANAGGGHADRVQTGRKRDIRSQIASHPGMLNARIDANAQHACIGGYTIAGDREPVADRACAFASYYVLVFAAMCAFTPVTTASAMERLTTLLPLAILDEPAMDQLPERSSPALLPQGFRGTVAGASPPAGG